LYAYIHAYSETCIINLHVWFFKGEQYTMFLQETLPELLDDIPLAARPR